MAKTPKFTFIPFKKSSVSPEVKYQTVSISPKGIVYFTKELTESIGAKEPGSYFQLFVDRDRKAMGFKIISQLHYEGHKEKDRSLRFVRLNQGKIYLSLTIPLTELGWKQGENTHHVELKKYSDEWKKDVYYFIVGKVTNLEAIGLPSLPCPDCTLTFTGSISLGMHRRHVHGYVSPYAKTESEKIEGLE